MNVKRTNVSSPVCHTKNCITAVDYLLTAGNLSALNQPLTGMAAKCLIFYSSDITKTVGQRKGDSGQVVLDNPPPFTPPVGVTLYQHYSYIG